MIKSSLRIAIVLLGLAAALEAFWFSCEPQQRRDLLIQVGRDDLSHWLNTDHYQPLLVQLVQMKRQQVMDQLVEEHLAQQGQSQDQDTDQLTSSQRESSTQTENTNESSLQSLLSNNVSHRLAQTMCGKPPTQSLNDVKKQAIYKWVDEDGKTHYGEAPAQHNAQDLSAEYGQSLRSVRLRMEYPSWAGDSRLEKEIDRQGKLVHKVLSYYIPKQHLRQINLKIVLFKDVAAFEKHKNKQQANAFWGAYYSSGNNTIYLPRYPQLEQTLAIARHEMTHAMVAGMLGRLPVWLNEGLAEYMESFSWQMNAAIAEPPTHDYERLKGTDLRLLSTAGPKEFYGDGHERNYRQAAASVYFLLDHQAGRKWFKQTLADFAENPCGQQFAQDLFNKSYPGGIDAAANNWQRWLRKGKFPTHRY